MTNLKAMPEQDRNGRWIDHFVPLRDDKHNSQVRLLGSTALKEHSEHRSSRSYRLFAAASILALVSACAEGGSVNHAATAGNETLPAENMAMPMDEASDDLVFGDTASDPGAAPDTNSAGTVSAPAVGENKPEVESAPKAKAEAPRKPSKAESRAALKAEPKRAPKEAAGTSTCAPRSIERWATADGFRTSFTALPETG